MIEYLNGDITTFDHGIIGHGVNCKGVMGSGVALAIRKKWPEVYQRYHEHVKNAPQDLLGTCHFVRIKEYLLVANMFTQLTYGRVGKHAIPNAIEKALNTLVKKAYSESLPAYIPKVGCGLGGMQWETDVKPIVEKVHDQYPEVSITVVEYST